MFVCVVKSLVLNSEVVPFIGYVMLALTDHLDPVLPTDQLHSMAKGAEPETTD